jgi:hypothetical protein
MQQRIALRSLSGNGTINKTPDTQGIQGFSSAAEDAAAKGHQDHSADL